MLTYSFKGTRKATYLLLQYNTEVESFLLQIVVGWNLGPPFWTQTQAAMNGMVPYIISKEEMERVPAAERIMVTVFLERKLLLLWTSVLEEQQWTPATISKHIYIRFLAQEVWTVAPPSAISLTQVCTTLRPSQNLDGSCCCMYPTVLCLLMHLPYSLDLAWSDFFLSLEEKDCREGRATFNGQVYILLLNGGWSVSTNRETTLKSIYAISNIVVKLCEIFKCSTSK